MYYQVLKNEHHLAVDITNVPDHFKVFVEVTRDQGDRIAMMLKEAKVDVCFCDYPHNTHK